MSEIEKSGEKPVGDINPNRNAQLQRKGVKLNKTAFWSFIIVQVVYLGFGGYSILMMITGWEKVTDFENDGKVTKRAEAISLSDDVKLPPIDTEARGMFFMATAVCVGFNIIMLFTMRRLAGIYVWLGPAMFVLYLAAAAGLAAAKGAMIMALSYGVWVPIILVFLWILRGRFALGKYLLSTAGHISAQATNVFGAVFVNLFVQFALGFLNIFAIIGCFLVFQPEHEDYALFLGYYDHRLCIPTDSSSLAECPLAGGPFSKFYFGAPKGERGTFRALRLAISNSTSSIAFGTLLVGLLLDGIFGTIAQADDNSIAAAIACLLSCFLSQLESLLQMFNKYAFIFIGKRDDSGKLVIQPFEETYWEATVHCFGFIKRRPKHKKGQKGNRVNQVTRTHAISTIVNDDITGIALGMACFSTATLCAIVTFLYIYSINDRVISDHWYDWVAVGYAFVLGLTIGLVTTSALEVGVSTLFVCMSEDIKHLKDLNPEFECWIRWKYADMFEGIARVADGEEKPALGQEAKAEFSKKYDSDGKKGSVKNEKGQGKSRWKYDPHVPPASDH